MKKMPRLQWLIAVLASFTLIIGLVTSIVTARLPALAPFYSSFIWLVLFGLIVAFAIVSLLQGRMIKRRPAPLSATPGDISRYSVSSMPVSPYIVGPPIVDPAHFYGRNKEVEQFFAHLNSSQPHSLQVLGLRRSGKTSLLKHVSNLNILHGSAVDADSTRIAYVDLQSHITTAADFYLAVAEGLTRNLDLVDRRDLPQEGFPTQRSFEKWLDAPPFVGCRLVILLDEFESLRESAAIDIDFFKGLRSLVSSRSLAWVTTSYRDLYHLGRITGADEKTSPLFNVFHPTPIILSGLESRDADNLIQKPAQTKDIQFTAEELTAIQRFAGRLPFFLQAAAEHCFNAKLRGLSLLQVWSQVKRDFMAVMDRHFRWYWAHFTDDERDVLIRIANDIPTDWAQYRDQTGNIAVDDLSAYGLVTFVEDSCHIAGTALADWIRTHVDSRSHLSTMNTTWEPSLPYDKEQSAQEKPRIDHRGTGKPRIFISHSSQDKSFTDRLASDLKQAELYVWYDTWEIEPGTSIVSNINTGLQDSDYLVVVFSPNSVSSTWVQQELNAALMTELDQGNIIVLPILYQTCTIPPLLSDRLWVDFRNDYQSGLKMLLDVISQKRSKV
jgi:hypothetical protein